MSKHKILYWLPEELRQKTIKELKGFRAVSFPSAYFVKVPKSQHVGWLNLSPSNEEGIVLKSAPDFLIEGLIKTMNKYNQSYDIINIGEEDEEDKMDSRGSNRGYKI